MKFYLSLIAFLIPSLLNAIQHLSFKNGFDEDTTISVKKHAVRYDSYIDVTYEFEGAYVKDTIYEGKVYQQFFMRNSSSAGLVGNPELPAYIDLLLTASNSSRLEVLDVQYSDFENFSIMPTSVVKTQGGIEGQGWIFSDIYSRDEYYPDHNVQKTDDLRYKTVPYISLQVNPIQYNPQSGKIRCCKTLSFRVFLISDSETARIEKLDYKQFCDIASSELIDCADNTTKDTVPPPLLAPTPKTTMKTKADYVIVTVDKYLPAVNKFVSWKTMQGFKCKVISKGDWQGDSKKVLSEINAVYKTDQPEYLLVVGSISDVPSNNCYFTDQMAEWYRVEKLYYSDLPYAGGSLLHPNMYNGRIPVDDLSSAYYVVDKIINYEREPVADPYFYQKATHCSYGEDENNKRYGKVMDNFEDGTFIYSSEQLRYYMMGRDKVVNRVYRRDGNQPQYYSKIFGKKEMSQDINWIEDYSSTDSINNELNDGRFYILYNAHGLPNQWSNVFYFSTDISSSLRNGNKLPVVFAMSCETGKFEDDNCISSKFLTLRDGGAVAVFASSAISFYDWNDAFQVGMFNTMFPKPGMKAIGNDNTMKTIKATEAPIFELGKVMRAGLNFMYKCGYKSSDYLKVSCNEYFCFGDPSMQMYTEEPTCFNPTIIQDGSTVTISTNGVLGCKIAVTSIDGEIVHVEENSSETTFYDITFPFNVVISKHNYKPYVRHSLAYVQNDNIRYNREVLSDEIYVGRNVTSKFEQGDVVVQGEKLTLTANKVHLYPGFRTEGGKLLVHKGLYPDCPFSYIEKVSQYNHIADMPDVINKAIVRAAAGTTGSEDLEGSANAAYLVGNTLTMNMSTPSTVEVYDVLGRSIYRKPNLIEGTVTLSPGVYLVKYGDETKKIVVTED